jgi:hypothetical protein
LRRAGAAPVEKRDAARRIFRAAAPRVNRVLTITDYESKRSFCLDSEWLLSILFDASRLPTQKPPPGGFSLFFRH